MARNLTIALVACATAALNAALAGTAFKNQLKDAYWDDPANAWQTGGVAATVTPGQDGVVGDTIELNVPEAVGVTNTLTLRGDVTAKIQNTTIKPGNKGVFCFDGNGHTLLVPNGAEGETPYKSGFQMSTAAPYSGQHFFAFEDRGDGATTSGVIRIDNGFFRMSGSGRDATLEFLRGTFDHYSPMGVPGSSGRILTWGGNVTTNDGALSWILRGPTTKWIEKSITFKGNSSTNVITIADGATLDIRGSLSQQHGIAYPTSQEFMNIENGGVLKAESLLYGTPLNHTKNFSTCPHHVRMDGGRIEVSAGSGFYGTMDVNAKDSTISFPSTSFDCGGSGRVVTQRLCFAECVITGQIFRVGDMRNLDSRICGGFSNTVIATKANNNGQFCVCGDLDFVGCRFVMDDYITMVQNFFTGSFRLSQVTNSLTGTLVVGGNAETSASGAAGYSFRSALRIKDSNLSYSKMLIGANCPGLVAVTNSSLTLTYNEYMNDTSVCLCPTKVNSSDKPGKDGMLWLGAGAVLNAGRVCRDALRSGSTARAELVMDGATFNAIGKLKDDSTRVVAGLDSFRIGPGGAVFNQDNSDTRTISQDACETVAGEGRFVKTGLGTLAFADMAYDVAETVVSNGTLQLGEDVTFATALTVANGARFSSDNGQADAIALTGLTVTGGTLVLDPDDAITVDGSVSFESLSLVFATTPTLDRTNDVLTVIGPRNSAAEDAWAKAYCASAFGDATYALFEAVWDAERGRTVYRVTRKNEADPLSADADKVWTGTGAWSENANWSQSGVPTATSRAVFSDPAAGAEVTVRTGDRAGALAFRTDEKSFTVTGGSLSVAGEQGAAEIVTEAGTHEIAAPLTFPVAVNVKQALGSRLTLSGAISGGSLRKSGGGELVISGDNAFHAGATLVGGRTVLADEGTLHADMGDTANTVSLRDGTLVFDETSTVPFDPAFVSVGDNGLTFAIVSNAVDVDVRDWDSESSGFVKLGGGTLTVRSSASHETYLTRGSMGIAQGNYQYVGWSTFPADGTTSGMQTNSLWALNILEGELRLKGEAGRNNTFHTGKLRVGARICGCHEQPALTLDGANLTVEDQSSGHGNPHFGLGCYIGADANHDFSITNCRVTVVNGGSYVGNTVYVGSGAESAANVGIEVILSNGTFRADAVFGMASTRGTGSCTHYRAEAGSALKGRDCSVSGHIEASFDDSSFECVNFSNPTFSKLTLESTGFGSMAFRNGSVVKFMAIAAKDVASSKDVAGKDFRMIWDDAEWDRSTPTDYTFDESNSSDRLKMVMEGKGMKLNVQSGSVFETKVVPFIGEGGMVKVGDGALKFRPGTYGFTGPLEILAGSVDLSDAGPVTNACFAGSGTVSGGTLVAARFLAPVGDDWSLDASKRIAFSNCSFDGRLTVDLGRTESNPLVLPDVRTPIAIATYVGSAPSSFRVTGTGNRMVKAVFEAKDGVITMTPSTPRGAVFVVR